MESLQVAIDGDGLISCPHARRSPTLDQDAIHLDHRNAEPLLEVGLVIMRFSWNEAVRR